MKRAFLSVSMLVLALSVPASAEAKLASVFGDHMVLQQGKDLPIYGTAAANEKVTVTFRGKTATTTADADGNWRVTMGKFDAGGPFELTANTVKLTDVMVGEVWVCSGQSNMELPMPYVTKAQEEIAAANFPQIRLMTVPQGTAITTQKRFSVQWSACTPQTVKGFSAVGYFFGRDLHKALKVPVGLIHSSWGGTIAEAWTSPQGFKDPSLVYIRQQWEELKKNEAEWFRSYSTNLQAWKDRAVKSVAAGEGVPPGVPICPTQFHHPNQPCVLYNAMIAPMTGYPIRGVIWYQGESNALSKKFLEYYALLPGLIKDWRTQWQDPEMTFLVVQLSSWGGAGNEPAHVMNEWACVQEAQAQTVAKTPKTGLAVTVDIGDTMNIHPANKQDVGKRLALAALAVEYGRKIEFSGPVYKSMKVEGDKIRLTFSHLGGGLVAKAIDPKAPAEGSELKRFAIAGEDKKFVWATAKIDGDSIVVSSPAVPKPVAVRYAWSNNPGGCNVYNKADLPMVPFRTDNWETPPTPGLVK